MSNTFQGGAFAKVDAFLGVFGASSSGGVEPPSAPTNFQGAAGDRSASFTWDAVTGATSYELWFSLTDSFGTATVAASGLTGTSYLFDGSFPGKLYYYWLVASNAGGNSAPSTSVSARQYVTVANATTENLTTPTGSWVLSTLFFRSGGNLPLNCNVYWDGAAQGGASLGDGTWEDLINGGLFDPAISGAFDFTNSSGSSVTFWDTEP